MKTVLAIAVLFLTAQIGSSWHDRKVGDQRIAEIQKRLKAATPCPWKSDGHVDGWWHNEQPGVMVRSSANFQCHEWNEKFKMCVSGSEGGPVAQVSSAYWSGSRNPVADAEFIGHSCEDIQFLLKEIEKKP